VDKLPRLFFDRYPESVRIFPYQGYPYPHFPRTKHHFSMTVISYQGYPSNQTHPMRNHKTRQDISLLQ